MKSSQSFLKASAALSLALVATLWADPQMGTFVDPRDNHKYETVVIGSKIWYAENAAYKTSNSLCYNNEASNCDTYGRLYNFKEAQKVCPKGWHLPESDEWQRFKDFIENSNGKEDCAWALKSRDRWDGSNRYGFNVLPAGMNFEGFMGMGESAHFWSSSEDGDDAYGWHLTRDMDFTKDLNTTDSHFSVRCLKDF